MIRHALEAPMFKRLNYTEPAVLRGIVVAVVALAAAVGVTIPEGWTEQADQLIVAIGVVAPIVAAFWTRRAVSPATQPPDAEDEANFVRDPETGDVIGQDGEG